ncbi:DUF2746 domain-containing protein [Plantibacter flavus]|uniref:DUF2746 domain-containing protein n=1 Tax=Plantibacter flavus TaxID=150123 RepID=UPI003F13C3C1
MGESVLVALIGGCALVLTAPTGLLALVLNRKVNAIRHQVTNHHTVNLREDLDAKHDDNRDLLQTIARDVGGMKEDLRLVRSTQARYDERLYNLETKGKRPWRRSTRR